MRWLARCAVVLVLVLATAGQARADPLPQLDGQLHAAVARADHVTTLGHGMHVTRLSQVDRDSPPGVVVDADPRSAQPLWGAITVWSAGAWGVQLRGAELQTATAVIRRRPAVGIGVIWRP